MRVVRNFLPVGQGAFYWEQFNWRHSSEKVNVIYDCGTRTGEQYVKKEINKHFQKGEEIQAVFISHLDDDHINGIPHLLSHCKVKNIFFPLLTQEKKFYLSLECEITGKSRFLRWFIEEPEQAIKEYSLEKEIRIHEVPEWTNIDYQTDNLQADFEEDKNVTEEIFEECKTLGDLYKYWIFKPFNFKQDEKLLELLEKLQDVFGIPIDNKRIETIWKNGTDIDKNKIINAYREVGPLNPNSMTLFSGIKEYAMYQSESRARYYQCRICRIGMICDMRFKEAGCLYTGDYDTNTKENWNELKRAYKDVWWSIGCVQVPHHGSSKNYNSALTELDAFMIISAGKDNQYNHPTDSVLKDLVMSRREARVVTEEDETLVSLIIE